MNSEITEWILVDICGRSEWHVREALVWLYLILRLVQPLKLLKHSQPLLEIKSRYFPLWIWPLSKALLDTSQNTLSLQDFFNRIFSFELEFMNDCTVRFAGKERLWTVRVTDRHFYETFRIGRGLYMDGPMNSTDELKFTSVNVIWGQTETPLEAGSISEVDLNLKN